MHDLMFYRLLLPLLAALNLAFGVLTLSGLGGAGWWAALELGTGAACCAIAGGLLTAGLSKAYWARSMRRQVATWRNVSDALLGWLEESRMPDEALVRLQRSLKDAVVAGRGERSN